MTASLERARAAVAACGRRLVSTGLVVGSAGNVSVRVGDQIAITPSGVPYDRIEPDDIAVVTLEGERLEGGPPSSELRLHLGIYASTRAGAVVHTHSPFATALSTVLDELPAVHYTMAMLGGAVPVVPYATYGTQALADATRSALSGRRAALLQSHGVVTYGRTLELAYERAQLVEWVAEVYTHARVVGAPRIVSAAELEDVARRAGERPSAGS
jgi:L-fuculose-phosphate aldolase